jgi:hypothetical protein
VTDQPPASPPDPPPPTPGERRLERPPSDRYRGAEDAGSAAAEGGPGAADGSATSPVLAASADDRPSPARGVTYGSAAAILGAVALALLGGALAVSAGLLVVAGALGYGVGVATVMGAAQTLARTRRPWIAATLAGLGAVLGQVGLWLYARAEGGVLAPVDYLGQTFGPLVPLEVVLAVTVAWWRAR